MKLLTWSVGGASALGLFFSLTAATAQPLNPTLTLADAVRLSIERSPQLAAHAAHADAARDMAVSAGQRPDPRLSLGISNVPLDGPQRGSLTRDFMTMRSVALMQELTGATKLSARAGRQTREAEVALARREATVLSLRQNSAQAWLARHYNERMVALYRQQRTETQLQVEAAEAAYRANRGAQADVFLARTAVAQLDERIRLAETAVATAQTRLVRWAGQAAEQPLAQAPDITQTPLPDALEATVAQHPLLSLLAAKETAAQAEVALAEANKKSDWSVELMFSKRGPAYSDMASVNFSVPLQWNRDQRQDRELAARLSMVEQVRAEREDVQRQLGADVREQLQQWQSRVERAALYTQHIQPLATQRTQAALASYRGGQGPLAAVLEARRMEIDTRMEALRIEMEAANLWAQLAALAPSAHAHSQANAIKD